MIAYIKGKIVDIENNSITVETSSGIAYEITSPAAMTLGVSQDCLLHTYLQVKEDGMSLFGFTTKEELKMFRLLISVSGVGPKAGISILSNLSLEDIKMAILSEDYKLFASVNGIGTKTAQKLVLELNTKVSGFACSSTNNVSSDSTTIAMAKDALIQLGYTESDAYKRIKQVANKDDSLESIIRKALVGI